MAENNAPKLKRSMTAGQMEMISLGGAIGVGLFMGSTSTIKWTGPSVLLAYIFVGLILYIVMRALGEMLYVNPGTGSFADYATEYVHPLAGNMAEWAAVFQYIVVGISEVVAATEYLKFWWPKTPALLVGIIIIGFLLLANLASAKAYASLEFWFSMIKVVTIVLMIIVGLLVILLGLGNNWKPVGFSNLWSHGGFFTGGLKGFIFSMSIIVGSYQGIELIGISAGEVANPKEAVVKSVKSVLWRILIFYVGAIFVIVSIYPWNQLSAIGSPFVETFTKVGITGAASIINFVVLTAALSGANSGIYSSSRMLFKLANEGDAPKIFGKISKKIVPSKAIVGITSGILIGFVLNFILSTINKTMDEIFVIVYSSSVLPGMVAWFVILLAEYKFRKHNPEIMKKHPFKLPLYPYSNFFAFAILVLIVFFMFLNDETRVSVTVGALVLLASATEYYFRRMHKKNK
ncbi:amino acid permease [Lactobacillus jensenii]|jgi:proline-specific permease proY|uniref:Amino acid permease n=3 Tax=Bacteria TaxID=2 RepID=A0A5N1IDF6_LACJE|nr:amino acid permease [Lactobacillus jensenii]EEQ68624.1 amino acid permease [Lactobacillus jensenii 1153]ERJ44662.1 alanine glycine permease [Lactobacillus jensenii MD IIE-70(2)]APT14632.1 amino acid permease [Lactobacillus jensenii]EEQ24800.1 amino acid permease [Lactobacillus jensenii 269-3]EEX27791.1 putative proline-specific permease ProY [Lactobacillus jensenii SJ-7A-US]